MTGQTDRETVTPITMTDADEPIRFLGYYGPRRLPVYFTRNAKHGVIDLWEMSDASGHIGYAASYKDADAKAEAWAQAAPKRNAAWGR